MHDSPNTEIFDKDAIQSSVQLGMICTPKYEDGL